MARKSVPPSQPIPFGSQNSGMEEARRTVLDKAVNDIIKRYGEGSIMRLGEAHHMTVEAIPTGSLSLDIALGVGGIPRAASPKFLDLNHPGKPPSASIS